MTKTTLKHASLDKKKFVASNEIPLSELKQDINLVEKVFLMVINIPIKWLEEKTGIVI